MKSIFTAEYKRLLEWIRSRRQKSGLTMREVSRTLKIPHSWVGKVETGERRLDILEYVKLCRVIGANPAAGLALLSAAGRKSRPSPAARPSSRALRTRRPGR